MNQSHKPPSIVVGIDGSKPAVQAALWAVDEAASRDIPLRLLYAIEPDDPGYAAHGAAARKLAAAENAVRYAFHSGRGGGPAGQGRGGDHPGAAGHLVDPRFGGCCPGVRWRYRRAPLPTGAGGIYRSGPGVIGAVPSGDRATPPGPHRTRRRMDRRRGGRVVRYRCFAGGGDGRSTAARLAGSGGHLPAIRSGRYRGRRPCQPGPLACPLATTVSRCAGAIGGSARRAAGLSGWAGSIGTHGGAQRERPGACGATCGSAGQRRVAGGRLHPAGRRSAVSVTVPLGSQTSWLSAAPVST
ncbi:hypothetical protein MRGA327_12485 [Mycobacterium tuberculosis RGTB327]|nr:hypothetical protein MRGA327_12485 [Mycobacterium tuberculosis RGTB327]